MAAITTLPAAVAAFVADGDVVALEGFSHLVPFAAAHEIIRQRRRDLTLVRMVPDLIYDQMIGAGCARKLIFSWGGNPGLGLLPRFRDAVEHDWPLPLELAEHSHAELAAAYAAGAAGLPCGMVRDIPETDLPAQTRSVARVACPFTGEQLTAVRAVKPDVAIIHAQQADRRGNVLLWGITGVQKEAVLAARQSIVTVEELCDDLRPVPGSVLLPGWVISAVVEVPGGARPSYAHGYYTRDDGAYQSWAALAGDRAGFRQWMTTHGHAPLDA